MTILPVADTWPCVVKLPPATLPVAATLAGENAPVTVRLPPEILAEVEMLPGADKPPSVVNTHSLVQL